MVHIVIMTSKINGYFKATISGIIGGIAAVTLLLLFGAYPELSNSTSYSGIVQFLHDWQTLFAAMIAMLAARMTIRSMRHQTESAKADSEAQRALDEMRWREEKLAENRLAIAGLPQALNVIADYTERQWNYLDRLAVVELDGYYRLYIDPKSLPSAPIEELQTVQAACRFPEKEEIVQTIASLSRKIQYQEARLKRGSTDGVTQSNLTSHFITCAQIQHLTIKLFEYFDQTYVEQDLEDKNLWKATKMLTLSKPFSAGKQLIAERIRIRNSGELPEDD
ncbi:MAG: hypothetical protein CMO04_12615 [Thalassospira sp.]|nr:hypothetical protein [Thalassospira sp.]|tara:strand:- start:1049 stop:1885 length:837 start_codon:yes stop_codon:yes gene_type:complete